MSYTILTINGNNDTTTEIPSPNHDQNKVKSIIKMMDNDYETKIGNVESTHNEKNFKSETNQEFEAKGSNKLLREVQTKSHTDVETLNVNSLEKENNQITFPPIQKISSVNMSQTTVRDTEEWKTLNETIELAKEQTINSTRLDNYEKNGQKEVENAIKINRPPKCVALKNDENEKKSYTILVRPLGQSRKEAKTGTEKYSEEIRDHEHKRSIQSQSYQRSIQSQSYTMIKPEENKKPKFNPPEDITIVNNCKMNVESCEVLDNRDSLIIYNILRLNECAMETNNTKEYGKQIQNGQASVENKQDQDFDKDSDKNIEARKGETCDSSSKHITIEAKTNLQASDLISHKEPNALKPVKNVLHNNSAQKSQHCAVQNWHKLKLKNPNVRQYIQQNSDNTKTFKDLKRKPFLLDNSSTEYHKTKCNINMPRTQFATIIPKVVENNTIWYYRSAD